MKDNNIIEFEEKAKKKAESREKKKKPRMKVSGRSVFELQKVMKEKTKSKNTS